MQRALGEKECVSSNITPYFVLTRLALQRSGMGLLVSGCLRFRIGHELDPSRLQDHFLEDRFSCNLEKHPNEGERTTSRGGAQLDEDTNN